MGSALGKSTQLETTMITQVGNWGHDDEIGQFGFYTLVWHGSQITQLGVTDPSMEVRWNGFSNVKSAIVAHHTAVCKIREIPQDY